MNRLVADSQAKPRLSSWAIASVARSPLLALAWPIFVEQGLRVLIGTVDTLMVSHIGDEAVAGLSVANQIVMLFIISFAFIGIGSSVVITHHLGAHDRQGADRISATAIATNFWIGLVVSLLVTIFSAPMLRLMQLPAGPLVYAKPFLALMGGTLFIESMNVAIAATLRAHTHTRDAMFVALGQNVLNVIGNCLLLFGLFGFPKLGVVGVAISSVFSRLAACVALWILLARRTHLKMGWRDFFRIKMKNVRRVLHIGLPAAGENVSYWIAFMVITTFIARMGATQLATQTYTLNINRWVILLNVSIGLGTEIIIGHLIGAGKFEEAYRELLRSLRIAFCCAIGGMILLSLMAPWLIGRIHAQHGHHPRGNRVDSDGPPARTRPRIQCRGHQLAARDRRRAVSGNRGLPVHVGFVGAVRVVFGTQARPRVGGDLDLDDLRRMDAGLADV